MIDPARARPQLWRTLLGAFLTMILGTALALIAIIIASTALNPHDFDSLDYTIWSDGFFAGQTPAGLVSGFAAMGGLVAVLAIVMRLLHRRRLRDLLGPEAVWAFGAGVGVFTAATILSQPLFIAEDLIPNAPFRTTLLWLIPILAAVLIQTGAEEAVFRGYLQTQLAARFATPWLWLVLPSVLFGALHMDWITIALTGAVPMADLAYFLSATLSGLLWADLTRVTGGIAMAWGAHFATNASIILFVSPRGDYDAISLYTTPETLTELLSDPILLWQSSLFSIIVWAILRLWLVRRQGVPA
ncbi:MAG: CPBP family intramembrane glutamic endopeptidase [Pseudomonadota bacterium]